MNLEDAIKKVLKEYKGEEILKTYIGTLANEKVFGFIISEKPFGKKVVVYSDGTITEPTGPFSESLFKSLKEV